MALKSPPDPADPRVLIELVLSHARGRSDSFHQEARAFRNRLLLTSALCFAAAVALVLLQWRMPTAPIFQIPRNHGSHVSRWLLMLLIMVFGAVGALVTAIPAMAAIPRLESPFNFPLQQGYVKIFFGGLTALVGVVVIGNTGVTNGLTSFQSLIGVAIVFGAGQQAVTQFLDKRAGKIVESGPG